MRDTKRRLEAVSLYDHTGIEKHLKKMAEKGWMLEKISSLGWIYRRTEPKHGQFSVTYYPKASEFDPEMSEGQQMYQEFTARSGWQFICSSAQMQVFYTEQENPTPIETDPVAQVENIHKAAKKNHLLPYALYLIIGVLNGVLFVSRLLGDPIGTLASYTQLFTGVVWTMLLLLSAVELVRYFQWYRKATRAAEQGEFTDTPNNRGVQMFVLWTVTLCFAYWIINVMAVGSVMTRWVSILVYGYMAALILIVNGVKQFLKRRKVSRGTNLTITLIVDIVLAFALMGAITFGTLRASRNGFFDKDAETYEYHGSTFILYQDQLPLAVEDLLDVDYDGYVRQRRSEESLFLGMLDVDQWPRLDDEGRHSYPSMNYAVSVIKVPFLYEFCKERLIARMDETADSSVPEGFKRVFLSIDPVPWGAEEAYQLVFQDSGPMESYLLCYRDRFVQIYFDWEPTAEHKAIVGEKLGGK